MFQVFQATGQPIITTLLKPNFLTNKWDGDLRLAFQFIPFAQNLLDQAGLSYILDLFTTPYLVRPDHSYDLVAMDTRNRAQQMLSHLLPPSLQSVPTESNQFSIFHLQMLVLLSWEILKNTKPTWLNKKSTPTKQKPLSKIIWGPIC